MNENRWNRICNQVEFGDPLKDIDCDEMELFEYCVQLRAHVELLEDAATRAADWFYAAGVGMEKTCHVQEETALRAILHGVSEEKS